MTETTEGMAAAPETGCICGGKGPAMSAMLKMALPAEGPSEHFRNAAVELMKGMRDLLDQRIQKMSHTASKGTKLNVD